MKRAGCIGSALVAGVGLISGCGGEFDSDRATPPRGSLGRELYSLVCDRVGAQALREDVTGGSFHAICHPDPVTGKYADKVDQALLVGLDPAAVDADGHPVTMAVQKANRIHRVARIEALGRTRESLVGALDAAVPDLPITPTCAAAAGTKPGASKESLRVPLQAAMGRLTDLYDDRTIPLLTESVAHVLDAVKASPEAQTALARVDARQGYRPSAVAIGVARPLLAYPHLVDFANSLLALVASDSDPYATGFDPTKPVSVDRKPIPGKAHDQLQQLFRVLHQELRTSAAEPALAPFPDAVDTNDVTRPIYARPLGSLELTRRILFAPFDPTPIDDSAHPVIARDARGVAMVPVGADRKIPAPFVDLNGDGVADIDVLGRFLTVDQSTLPSPFFSIDGKDGPRNGYGLAVNGASPMYTAIDTRKTMLSKVARDLVPLFAPATASSSPSTSSSKEAMMSLLAGMPVVFGSHDVNAASQRTYPPDPSLPAAWKLAHTAPAPANLGTTPVVLPYAAYHSAGSPLVDLLYAVGNVLGDATTDDTLNMFRQLMTDHPKELARLVGVGLQIKAIADKHPEAHIPAASTLWDELIDVFAKIAAVWDPQKGGILEDLIVAFGKDETLHVKDAFTAYIDFKDQITYQNAGHTQSGGAFDLNGTPFNLTTNIVGPISTPVDHSMPDTGPNRSALQKFMQLLHDANGLGACTKDGAVAHLHLNIPGTGIGIPVDYPTDLLSKTACALAGGGNIPPTHMPACGILRIQNVDELLLDVALGRAHFEIRDPCLNAILGNSTLTGLVGGPDKFLEDQSGIIGFQPTKPTVAGVSRLVYYDTPHDSDVGDPSFPKTRDFLSGLLDPVPSMACDPAPFKDSDGTIVNLRKCKSFDLTLRGRDLDSLFPIEELDFIKNVQPLAAAFDDHGQPLLFVDLFDALHLHWGSPQQSTSECDPTLPKTDARWCTQDGAVSYEPLLSEALKTDLFAALHDFIPLLQATKVNHCLKDDPVTHMCTSNVTYDGVHVLAESVRALIDPARAAAAGLKDRTGKVAYVRNDGSTAPQVKLLELLIDALKKVDTVWDGQIASAHGDTSKHDAWRSARSSIVDTFFAVNGAGAASDWANPVVPRLVPALIDALRGHVGAHCPTARFDGSCGWARQEMAQKLGDVVDGPTFAAALDLVDAIRSDDAARTELEALITYLLGPEDEGAQEAALTALHDVLQVFEDDENLTPLVHALSEGLDATLVNDAGVPVRRSSADALIEVLARVLARAKDSKGNEDCAREIDPERTLATVIGKLVTPMGENLPAPIEVFIDAIADVNRAHPEVDFATKLDATDYANIAAEISDFCANQESGLEQVYEVIREATTPG